MIRKSELVFIAVLLVISFLLMVTSGYFETEIFTLGRTEYTVKGSLIVSSVIFGFFGFFVFGLIVARQD